MSNTKTNYRISSNSKLPEGTTLSKKAKKNVKPSSRETYPLTKLDLGDSFFVPGKTARDLRGVIHTKSRTRGMKFVSESKIERGNFGVRVYRVK